MTMIVMGFSLLVLVIVVLIPVYRRQNSIRDMFWALVVIVLLTMGAFGMLAEGIEQMGWIR